MQIDIGKIITGLIGWIIIIAGALLIGYVAYHTFSRLFRNLGWVLFKIPSAIPLPNPLKKENVNKGDFNIPASWKDLTNKELEVIQKQLGIYTAAYNELKNKISDYYVYWSIPGASMFFNNLNYPIKFYLNYADRSNNKTRFIPRFGIRIIGL